MTALRTWLQQPLSKPWRQAALWAHVLSSSLWFGAVLAMMVLAVAKDRVPQSAAELRAFCVCVKLIDDLVIIATCGAAALSGIVEQQRFALGRNLAHRAPRGGAVFGAPRGGAIFGAPRWARPSRPFAPPPLRPSRH